MQRRKPVPTIWLMTDERLGADLWTILRRLPPGSGVVVRHHITPARGRRLLIKRILRIGHARRLTVIVAGGFAGADGSHAWGNGPGLRTRSAHSRREALIAVRGGADVVFVSPVFATTSHPGASPLGIMKAGRIGQGLGSNIIALGGMTARRWRRLARFGFSGWAAIDAHAARRPRQNRNAVPT